MYVKILTFSEYGLKKFCSTYLGRCAISEGRSCEWVT